MKPKHYLGLCLATSALLATCGMYFRPEAAGKRLVREELRYSTSAVFVGVNYSSTQGLLCGTVAEAGRHDSFVVNTKTDVVVKEPGLDKLFGATYSAVVNSTPNNLERFNVDADDLSFYYQLTAQCLSGK